MSTPPTQPHLTPQFCFSSTALQDFLRLSRSTIDDTITSSLNALLTPSSIGFDPTSTRTRQPRSSHKIPASSCQAFESQILFPTWQSRDRVLAYCAEVAAQTPSDWSGEALKDGGLVKDDRLGNGDVRKEVDNRADPYDTRPVIRFGKRERLEELIGTESRVEGIVRSRTWAVVKARCTLDEGDGDEGWMEALERYGKRQ